MGPARECRSLPFPHLCLSIAYFPPSICPVSVSVPYSLDLISFLLPLLEYSSLYVSLSLSGLSLLMNRVCTGQSSDSERARDQWQCAAATPQVNLGFSFVS